MNTLNEDGTIDGTVQRRRATYRVSSGLLFRPGALIEPPRFEPEVRDGEVLTTTTAGEMFITTVRRS